jgi:hypothetical protein
MAEHDFVDLHSFPFFFFPFYPPTHFLSLSLKSLYTHTHTCLITQPPAIFSFLPPLTNPIDGTKKKTFFPRFFLCFPFVFRVGFVSLVFAENKGKQFLH